MLIRTSKVYFFILFIFHLIAVDQLDPKKSYELVFHGLDGYAKILLNGLRVGQAVNTFIRYRFSVTGLLNRVSHTLDDDNRKYGLFKTLNQESIFNTRLLY